jgi:hypothetical protein
MLNRTRTGMIGIYRFIQPKVDKIYHSEYNIDNMKPIWSIKEVKCNWCNETIPKGERRLDDVVAFNKTDKRWYTRLHYHPSCWTEKTEKWWAENPIKSPVTRAGRPPLALDEQQRLKRKNLLTRLSQLNTYYTKTAPINWDKVGKEDLFEIHRIKTFEIRVTHVLRSLEDVGGIPRKYRNFLDKESNDYNNGNESESANNPSGIETHMERPKDRWRKDSSQGDGGSAPELG